MSVINYLRTGGYVLIVVPLNLVKVWGYKTHVVSGMMGNQTPGGWSWNVSSVEKAWEILVELGNEVKEAIQESELQLKEGRKAVIIAQIPSPSPMDDLSDKDRNEIIDLKLFDTWMDALVTIRSMATPSESEVVTHEWLNPIVKADNDKQWLKLTDVYVPTTVVSQNHSENMLDGYYNSDGKSVADIMIHGKLNYFDILLNEGYAIVGEIWRHSETPVEKRRTDIKDYMWMLLKPSGDTPVFPEV